MIDWSGDPNDLPEMGEVFLYQGEMWYWVPCGCEEEDCDRPMAYLEEDDEVDIEMTLRLRGSDIGVPEYSLIIEIGAPIEELATAILTGDLTGVLYKYMADDPIGKGLITADRFNELVEKISNESYGEGYYTQMVEFLNEVIAGLNLSEFESDEDIELATSIALGPHLYGFSES
jgi:hypothetical protein